MLNLETVVVASALDYMYAESRLAVVSRSLPRRYRHLSKLSQYGGGPHVVSYNIIIFVPKAGTSKGIFKFNFLALVVSE